MVARIPCATLYVAGCSIPLLPSGVCKFIASGHFAPSLIIFRSWMRTCQPALPAVVCGGTHVEILGVSALFWCCCCCWKQSLPSMPSSLFPLIPLLGIASVISNSKRSIRGECRCRWWSLGEVTFGDHPIALLPLHAPLPVL